MGMLISCSCGEAFWVNDSGPVINCPACGKAQTIVALPETKPPAPPPTSNAHVFLYGIAAFVVAVIGIPAIIYGYAGWNVSAIDRKLHRLPQERQTAREKLQKQEVDRHMLLAVTGPASLLPGIASEYRVETRSLGNQLIPAKLSVSIVNDDDQVLHEEKNVESDGSYRLRIPPRLKETPGKQGQLYLAVHARASDSGIAQSWLREKLSLASPVFATHLTTDKPMYQPGEVVSFRSLTLERFSLQPPADELQLLFTLTNGKGEKVLETEGSTRIQDRDGGLVRGPDRMLLKGVGAGEYAIPADAAGGEYTLTVTELHGRFPPQKRSFLVNQYEKPRLHKELEWARKSYGPGETVSALSKVSRVEGGAALVNQKVAATIQIDGRRYASDGAPADDASLTSFTDAEGQATLSFTLPARIERGEASLSVQFSDGANVETLVRPIPIVLRKLNVEFYPEGGDLIAGVPNRVYFQARTPLDKPAEVKGRLVNAAGHTVLEAQTLSDESVPNLNQGMGRFDFIPEAGQSYEFKVDVPARIEDRFPLPSVKSDGVVLSLPDGVTPVAQPIRAVLHSVGRERKLLLAVYARGRLLDHVEATAAPDRPAEVKLSPSDDIGGVYRVTAFEMAGDSELRPVAERLIYRQSPRKLNLAIHSNLSRYVPGQKVRLSCAATDEKGQPAPAVIMLGVVDQRVITMADEKTARALPTHFMLTDVRRPEEIEHADVLLGSHPRAGEALDLLLGTQGWRRFAEHDPEEFRRQHKEDADRLLACNGQAPLVTTNSVEVEKACRESLKTKLHTQHNELAAVEHRLHRERRNSQETQRSIEELSGGLATIIVWMVVLAGIVGTIVVLGIAAGECVTSIAETTKQSPHASFAALALFVALMIVAALTAVSVLGSNASGKFKSVADCIGCGSSTPTPAPRAGAEAPAPRRQPEGDVIAPPPLALDNRLVVAPAEAGIDRASSPDRKTRQPLSVAMERKDDPARGRFEEASREQRRRQAAHPRKPTTGRQFTRTGNPSFDVSATPLVVREYAHARSPSVNTTRSDFTETLFWHPALVLPGGSTEVSFDLCDSLTRFQVVASGHTLTGRLGAASTVIESRLPFSIEPKLPIEVTSSDRVIVPVALANDTDAPRQVQIRMQRHGFELTQGSDDTTLSLAANQRTRQLYRLTPLVHGQAQLQIEGHCAPFAADGILRTINVVPEGFPVAGSFSGSLKKDIFHEVVLPEHWTPGSMQFEVKLFPTVLSDVQQGLEGLLREPHGCFEQTSSSSYPNLLVLDYMLQRKLTNPALEGRAREFLERGYRRLLTFECQNPMNNAREGFEWFGGRVLPHEALTAYGLMQFRELARVYDGVDPAMLQRTRVFLLSRRDGKGGFKVLNNAHTFGVAPRQLVDAYIVWALTENSQEDDLSKELSALRSQSESSKDPYFLALVANSLLNRGKVEEAQPLLKKLVAAQASHGVLHGARTSITRSMGRDLEIETTALAVLAWVKAKDLQAFGPAIRSAVRWLGQQRGGYGGYGSTQATILALKAFLAVDREARTFQSGEVALLVGDRFITSQRVNGDVSGVITLRLDQPDRRLKPGKNLIRLEMAGEQELPYTLAWSYRTRKPPSSADCAVRLRTQLNRDTAQEGDTVRLGATLENLTATDHGMAIAIIGLPAGLTLPEDMKQLKELTRPREDGSSPISAWEVRGRELILYWRALAPQQKIAFDLDLICRVPGEYRGPASRAYLYYNADHKCWDEPLRVAIDVKQE